MTVIFLQLSPDILG